MKPILPMSLLLLPHDYPLSYAVDKNNAVLISILDKAIDSISDFEKGKIENKWK
jgi:hypothetical protein